MSDSLLNDLNDDQQNAVKQIKGPVLILAGAGSGKTRVLTYRVAYMISKHKILPENILMCTFTNKAASEMKVRVDNILEKQIDNQNPTSPHTGTFHSLCAKILRKNGKHIGLSARYVIYDNGDQISAIRDIMKKHNISQKQAHPRAVLHTISEAKNELIKPLEYAGFARGQFQEIVALVYREYQKKLKETDALDFDDLLSYTVELFMKHPIVLGSYQEQYQYILIDEYQDTNKAQYQISKLLSKRYQNICIVGDASQSIYRWRGADYRNIMNFKSDFPHTKQFNLEQNYRSTQTILDAAHSVISKNTSHPILKLWTNKDEGKKITLYEARSEHDEATYLIQTILQSGRSYNEYAILYRTNAQSRVLEEAFLHAGIPYTLVGGIRFYERKEIKDVLSYLRLLANPKDEVSRRRIEKIGKKRMQKFFTFADTIKEDEKLIAHSTLELLDQTLEITTYLSLFNPDIEEQASRLENIKELRSVATEFSNLHIFLENVALVEQEYGPNRKMTNDNKNNNAVTLMTMHAAKGLEFPTVFIVGMEEGLFPHSRSLLDKDELEEERRLCYVAITRAKDELYISHANRRLYFGTRTQNMISRFIADIPEHTIDNQISLSSARGFREDDFLL
ncbi:ATP-dependent helicase [Patescibacteria group bacterium]